jgi:DNA mismatch repair protein MutS
MSTVADTPMIRQYLEVKGQHKDAILFFRLGDFYEMFMEDALTASKVLDLTLTGRGKDDNRIPMCGIPYHAAENYISKLVSKGFKVAICEQVEDASLSKGLTKREVVKIITPGTAQSQNLLDESENNYLLAVCNHGSAFAGALLDISTGEFSVFRCETEAEFSGLLASLPTKEILIPETFSYTFDESILLNKLPFSDPKLANDHLLSFFKIYAATGFGLDDFISSFPAAWALLDYVKLTQKTALSQITTLKAYRRHDTVFMDRVTIKNLELTESRESQHKKGSLFWVLDYTKTAMGARKLKHMIRNPLTDTTLITKRLDAIEILLGDLLSREELRECLGQVYDLERLVSRMVSNHHNPREWLALKSSLEALMPLGSILSHLHGEWFTELASYFQQAFSPDEVFQSLITLIQNSIRDDAPPTLKDGRVIKPGFSEELDQLVKSFKDIREWIAGLEETERKATGLKSLKVGFNKVFGYYIEVSQLQADNVPPHYIRKQTLANAERFITPELKDKETILLHGEEKQQQLETALFLELVDTLRSHTPALQVLAQHLADIDTIQSLTMAAQKNNYSRPVFEPETSQTLSIIQGRHPILEKHSSTPFVPNTVSMNTDSHTFILLTGPNMAGKSTLMRQIALTVIMAQMGSFVPATELRLSPIDKLFTRIGALDNLYFGQSTFMVEMLETASILNTATHNSLVILDEVGRGTSTYDGMSIACAVSEHLYTTIGCRTLFATHYHELTGLAKKWPLLKNFNMQVVETDSGIVFTHQVKEGPADKSYGIHVAQMAGLPRSVIDRAQSLLEKMENNTSDLIKPSTIPLQMELF